MKDLLFITVTGFDLVGAGIIAMAMFSHSLQFYTKGLKLGLILCMLGLLSQAFRNIYYLYTGVSPTDAELPLWALKDMGISIFVMSWLWFKMKEESK
jgi:hypothetical protein